MNGKIRIRHIYKATELKRFGKFVKEVMGVVSVVNAETGARLKMR